MLACPAAIISFNPPAASASPTSCAAERQQQPFRGELPDQLAQPRSQRFANRDLALPRLGPRQQQIGHIDAGDQQDECDRTHQRPQRGAYIAHDFVLQKISNDRMDIRAERMILLADAVSRLLHVSRDFILRVEQRDTRFQTPNEVQKMAAALTRVGQAQLQRRPQFRRIEFAWRKRKASRHDARNGAVSPINLHHAPDHRRIARESPLPQGVRNHRNGRRTLDVVLGRDVAAKFRRYAE